MDCKFLKYLLISGLVACVLSTTSSPNVSVVKIENATESMELSAAEKWKVADKALQNIASKAVKMVLSYAVRSSGQLNLTSECMSGLMKILMGIKKTKLWAFKMLDAIGKLPSGVLSGNINSLGDYDLCINTEAPGGSFRGQYCSVEITPPLPVERKHFVPVYEPIPEFVNLTAPDSVLTALLNQARGFYKVKIRIAVCVPSTCTRNDVEELGSSVVKALGVEIKVNVPNCETKQEKIVFGSSEITIICILSALLFIVVVATVKDVLLKIKHGNDEGYRSELSAATECLFCFSMYTNTVRLLKKDNHPDSIKVFHGLKVVTLLWIILTHVYIYFNYHTASNLGEATEITKNPLLGFVWSGYVSVQTFFFISAVLVSYGVMKMKGKHINIFLFIFRRYWRLTPPLMFVIACVYLIPYFGSGPTWKETVTDDLTQKCREYWWTNLLYISNFVPMSKMCLTWSWYLAVDTQLYIVSLLVLIPLKRNVRLGFVVNICLVVIATVLAAVFQIYYEVPSIITNVHADVDDLDKVTAVTYHRPHVHYPAYCVGIFVGYFLASKKKLQIPLYLNVMGWIASFTVGISLTYGTQDWHRGHLPGQFIATLFICTEKLAWSLALAWVTIICMTGNGGFATTILCWDALVPLSRLTYVTYIIHPVIQYVYIGSAKELVRIEQRHSTFNYMAYVLFAFVFAYPVSMLFEAPFMALEKMLLSSKRPKKTKDDEEVQVPYFTGNGLQMHDVNKTDENPTPVVNVSAINIGTL